jgi:hypothetical protein
MGRLKQHTNNNVTNHPPTHKQTQAAPCHTPRTLRRHIAVPTADVLLLTLRPTHGPHPGRTRSTTRTSDANRPSILSTRRDSTAHRGPSRWLTLAAPHGRSLASGGAPSTSPSRSRTERWQHRCGCSREYAAVAGAMHIMPSSVQTERMRQVRGTAQKTVEKQQEQRERAKEQKMFPHRDSNPGLLGESQLS